MKKILFFLTLTLFCSLAKADDMILQILQSDGQVVNIDLKDEPKTTYENGNLIITTTKTTITYPLEKVKRYTYVSALGISSPKVLIISTIIFKNSSGSKTPFLLKSYFSNNCFIEFCLSTYRTAECVASPNREENF